MEGKAERAEGACPRRGDDREVGTGRPGPGGRRASETQRQPGERGSTAQGDSQTHLPQRPEGVEGRLRACPPGPEGRTLAQSPSHAFRGWPPAFPAAGSAPHPDVRPVMLTLRGSGQGLADPAPPAERSPILCPPLSLPNRRNPFPFPQASRPLFPHTAQRGKECVLSPPPGSQTAGGPPALAPPPPAPPRGPWCMLQSMQFLCLLCFLFSWWGGWVG